jgi:Predicted NTP binding protein (contains STAS domain)
MNTSTDAESKASLEFSASEGGELTVLIRGRLDSDTVPSVWKDLEKQLERFSISSLMVDASGLEYCDVNGSGLLIELLRKAEMSGKPVRITGLAKEIQNLLDLFDVKDFTAPVEKPPDIGMVAEIGMLAVKNLDSLFQMMVFVGQLTSAMLSAFRQPWKIRWKDALLLAERVGVDALPIVSLVGF